MRLLSFLAFVSVSLLSISVLSEEQASDTAVEYYIGIDLGTTYSCVGVFKNGRVDIIQNEQGNRITPSYVAFTNDGQRLIGDSAKNQLTSNPENTIYDAKRLIGRRFDESAVQSDMKLWSFSVVDVNARPYVSVNVNGQKKQFSAEEVSSMVLTKMKEIAGRALEANVSQAVITVPAYFNDAQRQATKDAGTIAGLNVLRIINEPTAAAIAYGFNKKEGEKNILVFDLGGGTFDVSILAIDNGVFEVLATNGNTHLGGQDFDGAVTEHILAEIKRKHKVDVSSNKRAVQRIRREAEKAKRALSKFHKADIELEDLTGDGTVHVQTSLTRAKFEELNSKLFKSTLKPLESVIKDSELSKDEISEVIMVGGSTRIPKIQAIVKDFFGGKEPNKGINPDEAVAYGAAIQAAILKGHEGTQDLVLLDVNPLSLGIETQGGVMTVLIPRNSRIPTTKSNVFSTVMDNQDKVQINVYEGERQMVKDNHLLGTFMLDSIKKAPRGVPKIEVSFKFDQDGILQVIAEEKGTGRKADITISNTENRPSQEDIDKMIKDAETYAEEDKAEREKVEAKLQLEGGVYDLKGKLSEPETIKDKLSEAEVTEAKAACEEVITWLESHPKAEVNEYKEKTKEFQEKVKNIVSKLGGGAQQPPPTAEQSEDKSDEQEEL